MNINESFPPGFSSTDVESIPAFLKAEEPMEEAVEDLGADVKDLPPEELQALDYASMYSLGSDFAISVIDVAFKLAMEHEQIDIETLLSQAWWRD